MLNISNGDTSLGLNYSFKFDSTGKTIDEIFRMPSETVDIAFNYDGSGRILKMSPYAWYHYNTGGNLDSLAYIQMVYSGYLGGRATLFDSYGNTISLSETIGSSGGGFFNFYYSQKVTGVKTSKVNNRTFALSQNYPNPFNPATTITYELPAAGWVTLKVFDILGREVQTLVNNQQMAGLHSVAFDASRLTSGTYFYRMQCGNFVQTKKFVLLK